jgi:fatty acid desaturase
MAMAVDQDRLARSILPHTDRKLRELARIRPWRPVVDLLLSYALIAGAFLLLAHAQALWAGAIAFVVIGTRLYALFIMGHDELHKNLFVRRAGNDAFTQIAIFAPMGMHLGDQKTNHLIHHRRLGTEEDPDRYLHAAANKADVARLSFFLSGLMTFPRTAAKVLSRKADGPLWRRAGALVRSRKWAVLAQAVIFGGIVWHFPWWYYPVFWIAPIYVHVFLADEIRAFCEHSQPMVPDSAADDQRLITYVPNTVERLIFAPMNMNYHAEHHLWVYVPYYNLPRLHALLPNRGPIEVRRSYLAYLWRYFRKLPLVAAVPTPPQVA